MTFSNPINYLSLCVDNIYYDYLGGGDINDNAYFQFFDSTGNLINGERFYEDDYGITKN